MTEHQHMDDNSNKQLTSGRKPHHHAGAALAAKGMTTPKATAKRQQFTDAEEGFLSTSPDSANGDAPKAKKSEQTLLLQHDSSSDNSTQPSGIRLLAEAFYQCACAEQCVTLDNILEVFKAPLSEDQAWALIYQFCALYYKVAAKAQSGDFELPAKFELHVHRDGSVHFSDGDAKHKHEQQQQQREQHDDSASSSGESSVIGRAFDNHQQTPLVVSHRKIISEVAELVYAALDVNLPADEQCAMSPALEDLFTFMTLDETDEDCIDEGIDEGDKRWDDESEEERNDTKELEHIIETCITHIKPAQPEVHYKAVCRALVTETIELRAFLQQVLDNGAAKLMKATESSHTTQQELAKLGFNDWARFWVQVIDELRRGVRLKKSNYERTPIEYELTPYEILMEDIRTKKYQLRKVMVNGDIPPRVKKDAHALILEFIRSRPPLKKASERQLGPPVKCTLTPVELLMESIRRGKELKHITPPERLRHCNTLPAKAAALPRSKQRLIKVDFSKLQDDEHIFDDSSTSSAVLAELHHCSQPKMPPYPIGGYMMGGRTDGTATITRPRRTTYDLATQSESRRASGRRHTIVGCQSNFDETHSMPATRPASRQSQPSDDISLSSKELHTQHTRSQSPPANAGDMSSDATHSASSLGPWNKSFMDKQTWMERGDDRLSVTLAEIVHIRSVMTKAELEGLPMDVRVKEDVEKRRVCFLCLRTRFSFFGPWGIQCKLCQRTVCAKCYTKMRIPSEHFRNVPLVMISPSLLSSPAGSSTPSPSHHAHQTHSSTGNIMDDQFPKSLIERLLRSESDRKTRNTVGSAPSSPKHQRSNMSTPGISVGPGSAAAAAAAAAHAAGHAVEALHDQTSMSASYTAPMRPTAMQQHHSKYNVMSRSMEGPRSLPVHSPAHRPLSNSSTLERKTRFSRGFALFSSGSHLAQDQKENLRGEEVTVCNDCQGLVNEITSSVKQKRSSARNRTIQNLTLDLTPVWK